MEETEQETDHFQDKIKTIMFKNELKEHFTNKEDCESICQESESDDDIANDHVSLFDSLSPEEIADLEELMRKFFDDYVAEFTIEMSSPDFKHNMCVEMSKDLYYEMNWLDICTADHIPEIREWVEAQCDLYYDFADIPQRQQETDTDKETKKDKDSNSDALAYIQSIPQTKQRSQEWYDARDNMITASSVWKIFASDAQRNSLIFEKCRVGSGVNKSNSLGAANSQNPMQWGAKYEPVSRQLYSQRHEHEEVEEYGCIPHRRYPCLGASPDGITENGRMVEIKNIVNREITGEPLEAYWIQMQIQMEVCGIDVCDFVETRFKEFDSEQAFYAESAQKGVILQFMPRMDVMTGAMSGEAEYVYSELNPCCVEVADWTERMQAERTQSVLYYTYYWWLDEYSECVVKRNQLWFEAAIPEIEECWATIVREREDGFGHRAPAAKKGMAAILAGVCLQDEQHRVNCALPTQFMNIVKLDA